MVFEIIVALVIFVLFVPLRFTFLFYISLLQNRGAMAVKMFAFSLAQEKFSISDGEITSKNRRNKEKTIELTAEDKSLIFINYFVNALVRKTILCETYICAEVGKKDDAMQTAIMSGTVLFLIDLIFAQVFSRKRGSQHAVDNETLFCQNKLAICAKITFSVTLFDAVFCLFKSLLKTRKRLKEMSKAELNQETKINVVS